MYIYIKETTDKKKSKKCHDQLLKFSDPLELVAASFRFFFCMYSLSSSLDGAACFALELERRDRSSH